jgi:hypothetical protein
MQNPEIFNLFLGAPENLPGVALYFYEYNPSQNRQHAILLAAA